MSDTVITFRTDKDFETTAGDLGVAVTNHQFGVMGIHDLKATMAKKGVAFDRECRVFEVCNPHHAKKVLEENMEISTALPCRISLYREGGQTVIATLRPTAMLATFETEGAEGTAAEVEKTMLAIMEEAAGPHPLP